MYGILIIDKAPGMTSHDIVNDLRRHLHLKRIGHAGTLDPFATGVMVILIDKATKLSKYFMDHDKSYTATITLGLTSDTLDITGKILSETDASHLTAEAINDQLAKMVGKIAQVPPAYSAIKVDGKKMVDLARKNKELPVLEPRNVEIYKMSGLRNYCVQGKQVSFEIDMDVSKGTYIRSFARDLGLSLGVGAVLSGLRRTKVGLFDIKDAICLEKIHTMDYELLDPIPYLGMAGIILNDEQAEYVLNGRFLPVSIFPTKEDTIVYSSIKLPLAIYTYDSNKNVMRVSVLLN
ncbi:MAG: tRNA pseudouridine(55) synthase TruB [Candidatus Izemoplasmatales bacterium]